MKTNPLTTAAFVFAITVGGLAWNTEARAQTICGDFNGSGSLTISDSYKHLLAVTGQAVELTCPRGLSCWDLNENGECDITTNDRTNEDTNGDGGCTVDDCRGDGSSGGPYVTQEAFTQFLGASCGGRLCGPGDLVDPTYDTLKQATDTNESELEGLRSDHYEDMSGLRNVHRSDIDRLTDGVENNTILGTNNEIRLDQCSCAPFIFQPDELVVFITSQTWSGDLGGLQGADNKCNAAAKAGGLPGTYKAWLGATNPSLSGPGDRIGRHPDKKWVNPRRDPIYPQAVTAMVNDLLEPIHIDEFGNEVAPGAEEVWSNAYHYGSIVPGGYDCNGWTSEDRNLIGNVGLWPKYILNDTGNGTQNNSWSHSGPRVQHYCNSEAHLYCFMDE